MKLGASQSIVQVLLVNIITRCPTPRLPRHGERLLAEPWMRSGFLGGQGQGGALRAGCCVKKGQVGGAVAGSWRLWWGRGEGRSGAGGVFLELFFRSLWSCSDKFQQCFDLKVPQTQFFDSGWTFLLCCADVYPQCKLCR